MKKMVLTLGVLLITAVSSLAMADPVPLTDFQDIQGALSPYSPKLVTGQTCGGDIRDVPRTTGASRVLYSPVISIQLSEAQDAHGQPDPSRAVIKATLAQGTSVEMTVTISGIHFDPNRNGDPILVFEATGTLLGSGKPATISCMNSY